MSKCHIVGNLMSRHILYLYTDHEVALMVLSHIGVLTILVPGVLKLLTMSQNIGNKSEIQLYL